MSFRARVLSYTLLFSLFLSISASSLKAYQSNGHSFSITPDIQAALDRISADSLRGHLSFIASDLLEGRNTPSPGLDIAAEYIAAQFRRAGLEPAGDDGYFQTAQWKVIERNLNGFELKINSGTNIVSIDRSQVTVTLDEAIDLNKVGLYKIDYTSLTSLAPLPVEELRGKVVFVEIPDFRRADRSQRSELYRQQSELTSKLSAANVALILSIDRSSAEGGGAGTGRLIDPENPIGFRPSSGFPMITIHGADAIKLFDSLKPGPTAATLSLKLAAPAEKTVKLRNVIGVLRGSDPTLKDTYVLVTAHYDHIGRRAGMPGDNIFNGANDDGSGTVSVIEIASALATLKQKPKRSIVFMTVFGEEKGLLGSRYYGRHPVFPIEKTVADINLEQVGRTDSSEGPQIAAASLTGFDYSDVGMIMKEAGEMTGIKVYKHERNSDAFFGRSDNQALADQGVPAHTLCTAFEYPDYHGAGDHWDKIDYDNMAKVDRMVALSVLMIAENREEPKWNEANPRAARYVKAWKERRTK